MSAKLKLSKDTRLYKCPFCDHRDLRYLLVDHVSREHEEMIPEEGSAAKIIFDHLNKGRVARCIVCKKVSDWDETKWAYKRICSTPCSKKFTLKMRRDHIKVHKVATLLNNDEHQIKMLANRKISGSYKFADGGIRTYVGTYERDRLEFMDTVMNFSSADIITPGPTIEYEFNGQTHKWITDCYIVPFNLVIDDKPGGTNKNTHGGMSEYNDKQDAKEETISKLGKYNYLRLTDKDFGQLLEAMMQIKYALTIDNNDSPIILINEQEEEPISKYYETVSLTYDLIDQYKDDYPELDQVIFNSDSVGLLIKRENEVLGFITADLARNTITAIYVNESIVEFEEIYPRLIAVMIELWDIRRITIPVEQHDIYLYHLENDWKVEREVNNYLYMYKPEDAQDESIDEAFGFKKKNIEVHLDKWGKENNILYITGQSGSGKTTLSEKLAKDNKAIIIELDWIDSNMALKQKTDLTEGEQILFDIFDKNNAWFEYDYTTANENFMKVCDVLIDHISKDKASKYIVEGIHIFLSLLDVDKNDSIIIMGTSANKSAFNVIRRKYNKNDLKLIKDLSLNKVKEHIAVFRERQAVKNELQDFINYVSEDFSETDDCVVNEAFDFNKPKLIKHNVDKWGKENNILYITGQSGSGKTTLSKKLAKDNDAILIELDWIDSNGLLKLNSDIIKLKEGQKIILEYFENNNAWFDFDSISTDESTKEFKKAYSYIIDRISKDKSNKYIVEGIHIFLGMTDVDKEDSIIIVNTSSGKSAYNAIKRKYQNNADAFLSDLSYNTAQGHISQFKQRKESKHELDTFIRSISEGFAGALPPSKLNIVAYSSDGSSYDGAALFVDDNLTQLSNGEDHSFLKDKYYNVFRANENNVDWDDLIKQTHVNKIPLDMVLGENYDINTLMFDSRFTHYSSKKPGDLSFIEAVEESEIFNSQIDTGLVLESMSIPSIISEEVKLFLSYLQSNGFNDISIEEDCNGYFAINSNSNKRTKSHSSVLDISLESVSILDISF